MLHGIKGFFRHMTPKNVLCYAGGLSLLMALALEVFCDDHDDYDDHEEAIDCEEFKEVVEDLEKENEDEA